MKLTAYLDRLDESRRSYVLGLLDRLPSPHRHELTEYLSGLGGRIQTEERLKETYLFAPSRWPQHVLRETAVRSAQPALRHLVPTDRPHAPVFVSREFSGISDMWIVSLPPRFRGGIEATGSVAIMSLAGVGLEVSGQPASLAPVILDRGQVKDIHTFRDGALALVVASPALVDHRPDGSWLIRHSDAGAKAEAPQLGVLANA